MSTQYAKEDPQTFGESKTYAMRAFDVIWKFYKKDRRGNIFKAKSEFALQIEHADNKQLIFFLFSFDNYVNSTQYEKGIIMNLTRFISEWENFLPDTYEEETDIDYAITKFEESYKSKK